MITEAPLADYAITGFETRYYSPVPEVKMPGGTCWHCGTAISICVQIRHHQTGETHEIGSTCAERVGLDVTELKKMLRQRNAAMRAERTAAERRAYQQARDEEFGAHGTETRFANGCRCTPCKAVAPHGAETRWHAGCECLDCVEGVLAANPRTYWIVDDYRVLIDLATGRITDAEIVRTQYGCSWCVTNESGRKVWVTVGPARRSTQTKKGYVEAYAPMLVVGGRDWHRPRLVLGEPLADRWGEPIHRT